MEKLKKRNFKKKTTAIISAILILALLAGGTYAYFAAQEKVNLFTDSRTFSGGIARDDYEKGGDGNKDVYIENPENNDNPLYARIRLEEYLDLLYKNGQSELLVGEDGATRDPKNPTDKWIGHEDVPAEGTDNIPAGTSLGEGNGEFDAHSFWEWIMGGSKVYLPAPEGAIPDDGSTDVPPYSDIKEDYIAGNTYDGSTAKETPVAEVIAYDQWDGEAGNFWVLSEDGWFYWANPIMPGEASGLLLNAVNLDESKLPDDWKEYYYAINVLFEFWDIDDWDINYGNADIGGKAVLDAAKAKGEDAKTRQSLIDELNALVKKANEIYSKRNNSDFEYVKDDNWDDFTGARTAANAFMPDINNKTTQEIQDMINKLDPAIDGLTRKTAPVIDKSKLEEALQNAADLVTTGADSTLINDFNNAVSQGQGVLTNTGATQEEVNNAAKAINDAIAAIEADLDPTILTKTPDDSAKGFIPQTHPTDIDKDYNIRYDDDDGTPVLTRAGSILLKDILDIDDVSGFDIEIIGAADKAKFGDYVKLGKDTVKGTDEAIIISYLPTAKEFTDYFKANDNKNPEYTITVKLTKGSKSATVKITMMYTGALGY